MDAPWEAYHVSDSPLKTMLSDLIPCDRARLFRAYDGPLHRRAHLVTMEGDGELFYIPQTSQRRGQFFWIRCQEERVTAYAYLEGQEGYIRGLSHLYQMTPESEEFLLSVLTVGDVIHDVLARCSAHEVRATEYGPPRSIGGTVHRRYSLRFQHRYDPANFGVRYAFVDVELSTDDVVKSARILATQDATDLLIHHQKHLGQNPHSQVEHLRGLDQWSDFETLVGVLSDDPRVVALGTLDGPDMRVFDFTYQGGSFSLIYDDPYGHELRANRWDFEPLKALARYLETVIPPSS